MHQARKQGAKIVSIDPYRCQTAARSDWWLPIRPGTDAALALGLMHVIWREGWHDQDYLDRHCLGGDLLRQRTLEEFGPAKVAAITGIPAEDVERLARVRHGHARARRPGVDPPQLRLAAARRRRHGGADDLLSARRHRGLASRRRWRPAQHQRPLRLLRQPGAGTARPDSAGNAHHQHGPACRGPQRRVAPPAGPLSTSTTPTRLRSVPISAASCRG